MKTPQPVIATLELLRAEHSVLQARLDAIDLAVVNLQLVWPLGIVTDETAIAPPRKKMRRQLKKKSRVKAPAPAGSWTAKVEAVNSIAPSSKSTEAADRRALLLGFIQKSEVGLTLGELRTRTPKMSDTDRQNALTVLKAKGEIKRAGNTWTNAA